MKLYRVFTYYEKYYKSLYKPVWKGVEEIFAVDPQDEDPSWWNEYIGVHLATIVPATGEVVRGFWTAVHRSPVWKETYQKFLELYSAKWDPEIARMLARQNADYLVREILRSDVRRAMGMAAERGAGPGAMITAAMAAIANASLATVVVGGMVVVAALAVAILVWNPESEGKKETKYVDEWFIMVYESRAWWSDHIATNGLGERVYIRGMEIPGEIEDIKPDIIPGREVSIDSIEFVALSGTTERIEWIYEITTPMRMEAEYLGFVKQIGKEWWKEERTKEEDPRVGKKIYNLLGKIAEIEWEIEELENKIDREDEEDKIEKMEDEIGELEDQIENLENEIERLEEKIHLEEPHIKPIEEWMEVGETVVTYSPKY